MRYDPHELHRLQQENAKLREQVRTLAAELAGKDRAKFILVDKLGTSERPPSRTAHARTLLTDEVVELAKVHADVFAHAAHDLLWKVNSLAKIEKAQPLDYMWRLVLERDFHA